MVTSLVALDNFFSSIDKSPALAAGLPGACGEFARLSAKSSDPSAKFPELTDKFAELTAKFPEPSDKFAELSDKFHLVSGMFAGAPENLRKLSEKPDSRSRQPRKPLQIISLAQIQFEIRNLNSSRTHNLGRIFFYLYPFGSSPARCGLSPATSQTFDPTLPLLAEYSSVLNGFTWGSGAGLKWRIDSMSKTTDGVLADLDTVIQVWSEKPAFSMGDLTLTAVRAKRADLAARGDAVDEARTTLSRLIDEESDTRAEVEQIVTRARSGARATFGPDSPEYAQMGGTRASERKPKTRKGGSGGSSTGGGTGGGGQTP